MEGRDRRALCLVRPPGPPRPARRRRWASASSATSPSPRPTRSRGSGSNRILIVDFDVHHGNGTQEIFYDVRRVGFLSIHRYPVLSRHRAPRTRPGRARASGITRNIPLPYGTPRAEYPRRVPRGLDALADKIKPELVLISAGFDAHAEDPVGDLGLEVEDFETLTKEIVDVAETHAEGRIVSVLEGGYNVPILAGCVAAHLHALGAERRACRSPSR